MLLDSGSLVGAGFEFAFGGAIELLVLGLLRVGLGAGLQQQLVADVLAAGQLVGRHQFGHLFVSADLHQQLVRSSLLSVIEHNYYQALTSSTLEPKRA